MRHFAAEKWDFIDKELWKKERKEARLAIKQDFQPKIYGSDINANAVKMSMENANNAGVGDCIKFAQIHLISKIALQLWRMYIKPSLC